MTVQVLEDKPPGLSLRILFEDHGYSYEWTRVRTTTHQNGRRINCNTAINVPIVVPGPSSGASSSSAAQPASQDSTREKSTQRPVKRRPEQGGSSTKGPLEKWWAATIECRCCLENVQASCQTGKLLTKGPFGEPLSEPVILFGSMEEFHLVSCERPVKTPPVW